MKTPIAAKPMMRGGGGDDQRAREAALGDEARGGVAEHVGRDHEAARKPADAADASPLFCSIRGRKPVSARKLPA